MSSVRVAALAEVPPGCVREFEVDGRPYAVCNVEGQIFAVNGTCPHAGGRLGHGALHGYYIACPWHAWEFDCRNGAHDFNGAVRVETYPVRVEGGEIWLDPCA